MPSRLFPAAAGLVLLLTACASDDRPLGAVCQGVCSEPGGPVSLTRARDEAAAAPSATERMADEALASQIRSLMRKKADALPGGAPERALADLPSAEDGRLRILALSSGGPFGAFGAGFLNGWSEQTDEDLLRPARFDVVTGVSAGALLATYAFLGPERDGDLERQYTTISTEDVFRRRSLLRALFSNAFFDTAPLRDTLERLVTPALLDEVAAATAIDSEDGRPNRLLLVLAVNLDSGLPRIFDLGAIARERSDPDRIDRYIDVLMASAAIPVAFPPVFIDGDMHADGGARLALFFNRYMEDQRKAMDNAAILPPRLDIVLNSEVTVAPECTANSLVGIGGRSIDVVLNQLTLDGLYRTIGEAERDGVDVRFTTAEGSGCVRPEDPADPFERTFLQCLFAHGQAVGSGETPWRSGLEDFPTLAIENGDAGAIACASG